METIKIKHEIKLLEAQTKKVIIESKEIEHQRKAIWIKIFGGIFATIVAVHFMYTSFYFPTLDINRKRNEFLREQLKVKNEEIKKEKNNLEKEKNNLEKEKNNLTRDIKKIKLLYSEKNISSYAPRTSDGFEKEEEFMQRILDRLSKYGSNLVNSVGASSGKNDINSTSPITQPKLTNYPPANIRKKVDRFINLFNNKNAILQAKYLSKIYIKYPDYVLEKLISSIDNNDNSNSYFKNLHILYTLALLDPGWSGTVAQYNKVKEIVTNSSYAGDRTFKRWGKQALLNYEK